MGTRKTGIDRRGFIRTTGLGALGLGLAGAGCGDGGGGLQDGGAPDSGAAHAPFSVVVLPDTQYFAESYPSIYTAQTQWIADNLKSERIVFVSHVGDVVDNGPDLGQWKNALQSMGTLDKAGVPYGVCLGNHDLQYSDASYQYPASVDGSCTTFKDFDCQAKHFIDAFGPKVFAGKPWYGGASPGGLSSYQLVEVEGIKLLFLHLVLDMRQGDLTWAQTVLDQHKDALVHVTTHRYMYDFRLVKTLPYPLSTLLGGRYTDAHYGMDDEIYFDDGVMAEAFFTDFVKKNTNIFMVHCGHFDAEYRQVSKNDAGLPVHEILVDFQTYSPNGGDGWLRQLTFDLDRGEIKVRTYSPSLKRYRKNGDGFDGSVKAVKDGLNAYRDLFKLFLDFDELTKKIDYWGSDPQGRKEYFDLLYGEGARDSEFTLQVDFAAYTAT